MESVQLSTKEKIALRAQAHALHPVVMIGQQSLTEAVINETNRNLEAHELIKVQIAGDDRSERIAIAEALVAATDATLIQHIGKQIVLYRRKKEEVK
ncbi:ribosome assembly RNA-binding protein YhbY [Neisseriaceae bacterium ESL0693]|nr:ribosome assembly RNA-binding protein YhbY [Neisseriaceae bacterium ESL0693]